MPNDENDISKTIEKLDEIIKGIEGRPKLSTDDDGNLLVDNKQVKAKVDLQWPTLIVIGLGSLAALVSAVTSIFSTIAAWKEVDISTQVCAKQTPTNGDATLPSNTAAIDAQSNVDAFGNNNAAKSVKSPTSDKHPQKTNKKKCAEKRN